ncbi:hypothetical protein VQH23_16320 [Pararoseomonas sp. SCSIO 73927]|uniref:hypothetical protein n=1 Tax=Pararoseomonas sp. SCSIO 73927 TaxID=3114537 RepID=UPI0030D45E10
MEDNSAITVEPCTGEFYLALQSAAPTRQRVASVLPVAFRRAARATPMPGQAGVSVLDVILAEAAQDPEKADAIEYAVRMERADLVEGGMPEALADAVLDLAATFPGADARLEAMPGPAPEPKPEPEGGEPEQPLEDAP